MIFHGLVKLFLVAICPLLFVASARAAGDDALMERLVSSYPEFLAGHEGNELVWKDGTRMPFDDGKRDKEFETLLTMHHQSRICSTRPMFQAGPQSRQTLIAIQDGCGMSHFS